MAIDVGIVRNHNFAQAVKLSVELANASRTIPRGDFRVIEHKYSPAWLPTFRQDLDSIYILKDGHPIRRITQEGQYITVGDSGWQENK